MSLESWKAEFYPVEAKDATGSDAEALEHSIVKWTGLLKKNLKKHDGKKAEGFLKRVSFDGIPAFVVDGSSCALCAKHFAAKAGCRECPIFMATGADCEKAFLAFSFSDNARPMLTLLKRTKKWLES